MPTRSAWRLRDTLAAAVLFLASAAFTLWQNTRVAVLWDISYLLDTSYRISLGQLPYRDFPFAHAPLTFLVHALIIRLFGRVYFRHLLCAALEAGAATLLTWRFLLALLKSLSDRAWSLATLLAAPLIVLGIYGIYPHPIYDSDAILVVLLALYLLQRSTSSNAARPVMCFLTGAACVFPLFFKQNIGLPFLFVTLAAAAALAIARSRQRISISPQLWLFAGAFVSLAAALLAIHATVGLHNYLYWTITFARQRRLPGLAVMLSTYRQASLLWTIPAAIAALILLRRQGPGAPSMAQSHRDMPGSPPASLVGWMGGIRRRWIAFILLAAPFLYTIAALALTTDSDDRAGQLLSLWPHILILSAALAVWSLRPQKLAADPTLQPFVPAILLVTIHGAFLSQQLWGSTYALWPLLTLLFAVLLAQVPTIARPMAVVIATTFLLCGGLYAISHERLSYVYLDGPRVHATLPELRGLTTSGPWIPGFEELVRVTNAEIPANDGILLLPGEDPFYFATGRIPQFPFLLFDPATDPYTPGQTRDLARARNIRWLIVTRQTQLTGPPHPDLAEITRVLEQDFTPYRTLANYTIYRRK
jgi:hypothetical protein